MFHILQESIGILATLLARIVAIVSTQGHLGPPHTKESPENVGVPNLCQRTLPWFIQGLKHLHCYHKENILTKFSRLWWLAVRPASTSLLLKMAMTVMIVEFGTIQDYASLEETSEACFCSFEQIQKYN